MARVPTLASLRDAAESVAGSGSPPGAPDGWVSAPFDRELSAEVRALVARLAPAQRLWLSGYLAGSLVHGADAQPAALPLPAAEPVTILFGSQSGNSESLARRCGQRLAALQVPHRLLDMLDCRKADLEQASRLLVIVSTHGDGDPPERAVPLFELLASRRAPRLTQLRFAVLALGDTSYEHFCAAGRRIDARLEELGAQRLLACVECDVEFESPASTWIESVATGLASATSGPEVARAAPAGVELAGTAQVATAPAHALCAVAQAWTRKHPFAAEVLAAHGLTASGSTKEVRHVELSLRGSGIHYEPGDALGIVPRNAESEVDALLDLLPFKPDTPVRIGDGDATLRSALLEKLEISSLAGPVVRRYAQAVQSEELQRLVLDAEALRAFPHGRDLRDLVGAHPPRELDAAAFVRLLVPLAPRLYSIASSAKASPDEVHLTVGLVAYSSAGRQRRGVVSGAVAGLEEGDTLPVYLHRNEGFRLPADPAAPIVMIGAGTGVAPYRGFLAEREVTGATGRNWLVFGDRSFELDFLYQSEWLACRQRGLLARLDVAFSRDQAEKHYVQHRLLEHGKTLWHWLQQGAHLYVCGDATRMAPDVESALLEIIRRHDGLDAEASREYLLQLQRERRYQKDVY